LDTGAIVRLLPMGRPGNVLVSFLAVLALAGGLTSCGGDGEGSASLTPEQTIDAWFEAARLGEAADKCELETERYMTEQYGGPGDPCLEDAANTAAQPVWAEHIVIVDSETSGDFATVTVQPNAGTDATATVGLIKVDGTWMIDSFV
jgi:hypothetical protein